MIYCTHGTLDRGALFLKSNNLACVLRSRLWDVTQRSLSSRGSVASHPESQAAEETIVWPLSWIHNPELKVLILFL